MLLQMSDILGIMLSAYNCYWTYNKLFIIYNFSFGKLVPVTMFGTLDTWGHDDWVLNIKIRLKIVYPSFGLYALRY